MTTIDSTSIWLPDAKFTRSAGVSLATSLYRVPLTIGLSGALGAGKTTFLQGFLAGLGVQGGVISPTFALEKRYETPYGQLLHIDLYRLSSKDAALLVEESSDVEGIRCIEWVDRVDTPCDIHITLDEKKHLSGRKLSIRFSDIPLFTHTEISRWQDEVGLPQHIRKHCDTVSEVTVHLVKYLSKRGIIVRPKALQCAAKAHDLLRFVDFKPETQLEGIAAEPPEWEALRNLYAGMRHEEACAAFLTKRGYADIASIVSVHGLRLPSPDRATIEQKVLYYADKRVMLDRIVSLEERFADFQMRYSAGQKTRKGETWLLEAKAVETELFGSAPQIISSTVSTQREEHPQP